MREVLLDLRVTILTFKNIVSVKEEQRTFVIKVVDTNLTICAKWPYLVYILVLDGSPLALQD